MRKKLKLFNRVIHISYNETWEKKLNFMSLILLEDLKYQRHEKFNFTLHFSCICFK